MHHGSARLTVYGRRTLVERVTDEGWSITKAAWAAGVSRQTASKWVARYRVVGWDGLVDRTTRPRRSPTKVPAHLVARIAKVRTRDRLGPHRMSWLLGVARSTIYAVLRRLGLNRLCRLEPRPPVFRYEWPAPGDLVHYDTKKLGRIPGHVGKRFGGPRSARGAGWGVVHVAIDDHSRLAYAEQLPDERGETAAAFLGRSVSFFASHGITVRRALTDNGSPYISSAFARELAGRGIAHRRTRPYTPRTNGKAEALVKILLNSWAYARPYRTEHQRARALRPFMDFYNHRRPHGGLNGARPIDRVRQ